MRVRAGNRGLITSCRLRRDSRVRRLRLQVSSRGTVELFLPRGCDAREALEFLERNRDWVKARVRQVEQRRAQAPQIHGPLPRRIELRVARQEWCVSYECDERPSGQHTLRLDSVDPQEVRKQLLAWLRCQARVHLVPWLAELSLETGLRFRRASLRNQRTRWGSCSSRGTISLNQNLMFLPRAVVRYLLIHELCHTRVPNHSPAFWSLVASLEPDYEMAEARLNEAHGDVPLWAYPD